MLQKWIVSGEIELFQVHLCSIRPILNVFRNNQGVMQILPSSLSTSFCNFWTERSANSARASAWYNIKNKIRRLTEITKSNIVKKKLENKFWFFFQISEAYHHYLHNISYNSKSFLVRNRENEYSFLKRIMFCSEIRKK